MKKLLGLAVAMMLGLTLVGCEDTIDEYDVDAGYLVINIEAIEMR